jgi:hypothetical protein
LAIRIKFVYFDVDQFLAETAGGEVHLINVGGIIMGLGLALVKIPWKAILPYVPTLVETAKELLRNQGKLKSTELSTVVSSPQNLSLRVAQLENNERKQAELIKEMADQQLRFVESLRIVGSRVQLLFWLVLALLITVVVLLVYHFVQVPAR